MKPKGSLPLPDVRFHCIKLSFLKYERREFYFIKSSSYICSVLLAWAYKVISLNNLMMAVGNKMMHILQTLTNLGG